MLGWGFEMKVGNLERGAGIEPATNGLGSRYSTIELLPLRTQLYLAESGEFPRSSIWPRKQFAGCTIIQYFFLSHVPLDFASDEHGNEAKMPGKSRVMRSLDRSDRRFAGFDGVEEVAPMLRRFIELHLAEFLREGFALDPCGIGCVES